MFRRDQSVGIWSSSRCNGASRRRQVFSRRRRSCRRAIRNKGNCRLSKVPAFTLSFAIPFFCRLGRESKMFRQLEQMETTSLPICRFVTLDNRWCTKKTSLQYSSIWFRLILLIVHAGDERHSLHVVTGRRESRADERPESQGQRRRLARQSGRIYVHESQKTGQIRNCGLWHKTQGGMGTLSRITGELICSGYILHFY